MFQSPGQNPHTPKAFNHSCRDAEHAVSSDHDHFHFTDTAAVPQKSRDYLNCSHYKRQLVGYLGEAFLSHAPKLLSEVQRLVVAGCSEEGKALI